MIKRAIEHGIVDSMNKGKAIIIYGPRQVGKTTLVQNVLSQLPNRWLLLNCDETDVRELLTHTTSTKLKSAIGNYKYVLIDEGQRVTDIGLTLKLFTDQIKDVQVIVTGSSSFELANKINEPLTGRKFDFFLFPFWFGELSGHTSPLEEKRNLEERLIFGYYPEIVTNPGSKERLLKLLVDSYLYKDLYTTDLIKKPVVLEKILKAIALQLGNEVSLNEIAQLVNVDFQTVDKYINLLEKSFVIFTLHAFSRNVRNEIKKNRKIYFYDCGVRNAIIGNFRPVQSRTDLGALWENFLILERMKKLSYQEKDVSRYFWRTTQQQEIDYIEEDLDGLKAYEFKWNSKSRAKFPLTFTKNYPQAITTLITPENFREFIT
ncbi:MAG: ATP-binding protein [Bacteroidetes bacterium]|nr:ATP-binding protein [Bacteroidota bacterium]MDA1121614.1 ATP-binding protein [Bacteroidota bacterium]